MTCGKLDIVCQLEVINKFNIEVSFQNLEKYSYFLFLFYKLCFFGISVHFMDFFVFPHVYHMDPWLKGGLKKKL